MDENATAREDAEYRAGVGIMLLNERGEVFVARRADVPTEAWQMPQGGIDDGEEPRAAALRELEEEIGTARVEIVAESRGWLSYELPAELIEKACQRGWRGQRQKWFIMRFTGTDGDINLDAVHPEFNAWKWVPKEDLPNLVVSFRRQVYLDLLTEYRTLIQSLSHNLSEFLAEPIVRLTMAADGVGETELYDLLCRVSNNLRRRGA
jgi:putative (di)nucleoside polyphosphate hydrolase